MVIRIPISLMAFFICLTSVKAQSDDYKHFFGICWRGTAKENLQYATNLGYKYVFYQPGMEYELLASQKFYYLESPEYLLYKRGVHFFQKYTREEAAFYNSYCTTFISDKPFPQNLATGWYFSDSVVSAELDFRKENVRSWAINGIIQYIKLLEQRNPSFRFGGIAWDVPQLSGDFWSGNQKKGGKQVSLEYFGDSSFQYEVGKKRYYKELFERVREIWPHAKFVMEPWSARELLDDLKKSDLNITPDLISQEGPSLDFMEAPFLPKTILGYSCPGIGGVHENVQIAGSLAKQGVWFNWYGRFGGSGTMPNYQSVTNVPVVLNLIRAFTNWENLNKTPLSKRRFLNGVYSSPTALFSDSIIWAIRPDSKEKYIIFLNSKGKINVGKEARLFLLDHIMQKGEEKTSSFLNDDGVLTLLDSSLFHRAFLIED